MDDVARNGRETGLEFGEEGIALTPGVVVMSVAVRGDLWWRDLLECRVRRGWLDGRRLVLECFPWYLEISLRHKREFLHFDCCQRFGRIVRVNNITNLKASSTSSNLCRAVCFFQAGPRCSRWSSSMTSTPQWLVPLSDSGQREESGFGQRHATPASFHLTKLSSRH